MKKRLSKFIKSIRSVVMFVWTHGKFGVGGIVCMLIVMFTKQIWPIVPAGVCFYFMMSREHETWRY